MARKRYYEAEFNLWVEEPDPSTKPACGDVWPDEWDHKRGPRPRCFRPEDHEGEHHATRAVVGEERWIEYYWSTEPGSGRSYIGPVEP